MPRFAILIVCAASAVLAGCGGAGDRPTGDPGKTPAAAGTQAAPAVVRVTMRDIRFVPRRVEVRVGQTVRWTNADPVAHTVAANHGARFSSDALRKGDSFEYTPTRSGTVEYFCTIHAGQTGTLVVR